MAQVDLARKEVSAKIVYYGPGLSGKTANIEAIYEQTPIKHRVKPTNIAAEEDQSLFYEFMPVDLGTINQMHTRLQLYTVPGQLSYNSTRKIVLQNADGVIFVADSRKDRLAENRASLENLEENLRQYVIDITNIPLVLQYNKRDETGVLSVEELNENLNQWGYSFYEAIAIRGMGTFQTLKGLADMVLEGITRDNRGTNRYYL